MDEDSGHCFNVFHSLDKHLSTQTLTIGIWSCMILFSFFSKIFFFLDVDNF